VPRFTEVFAANTSFVAVISGRSLVVTTGAATVALFCGFATTAVADAVDVCDDTLPEY
jgi:flagellar motor component MotA